MQKTPQAVQNYVKNLFTTYVEGHIEGYLSCIDDCLECQDITVTDDLLPEELNRERLISDFLQYLKENT